MLVETAHFTSAKLWALKLLSTVRPGHRSESLRAAQPCSVPAFDALLAMYHLHYKALAEKLNQNNGTENEHGHCQHTTHLDHQSPR